MRYKKELISICFIICLFSIASVCANEGNKTLISNNEQISNDFTAIVGETSNDLGMNFEYDDLLKKNSGTYKDIQNKINNANPGDIIKLNGTYSQYYNENSINITKPLTIEGYNLVIKSGLSSNAEDYPIFNITSSNVILKNITFTLGYWTIVAEGNNISIINCTFIDNRICPIITGNNNSIVDTKFVQCMGGIKITGKNNIVKNCLFDDIDSRAISFYSTNSIITNTSFINYKSKHFDGGAVYCENSKNSNITYCNFSNYLVYFNNGGAIYATNSPYLLISNCNFRNNSAEEGSSIYSGTNNISIVNCNFSEDYYLDTIYLRGKNAYINNCTFKNSQNCPYIDVYSPNTIISNCTFLNNSHYETSSAIRWYENNGLLTNCSFINLYSPYGAVSFSGKDNKINHCIFDIEKFCPKISYRGNLIYDDNFWGSNFYDEETIINNQIIAYCYNEYQVEKIEYKSPNSWINLKIEGDEVIQSFTNNQYKISFVYNNDSYINSSLPNYRLKINGTNLKEQYVYIINNEKAITYNSNIIGNNIINCFDNDPYNTSKIIISKNLVVNDVIAISPKNLITAFNSGNLFNIKVTNKNSKLPSNGVLLNLKIYTDKNFKNYSVKTNSKGIATFKGSTLNIGTHKVEITSITPNVVSSTVISKIIVKKATPKIIAKQKTFKIKVKRYTATVKDSNGKTKKVEVVLKEKSSIKKYAATLKDNTGKVMKKIKLSLKVNGKTYKATTNAKGQAIFKITNLNKKGTFKSEITFAGNKFYNVKKVTTKIFVR